MVKQNITNINTRRELLLTPADVMQILGVGLPEDNADDN